MKWENKAANLPSEESELPSAIFIEMWEYAQKNECVIVTQDADFNDLNSLKGFQPKIIWIRTGNLKTRDIGNILKDYATEICQFVQDDNYGCFEFLKLKPTQN